MSCTECSSTENLQRHHIIPLSEGGEDVFLNRIRVCKSCHEKIHGHGVGTPKINKKSIFYSQSGKLSKRRVIKQGGSRYISLPSKWFEINGLNPDNLELLIVASKDIRIVNPDHEAEVYAEISRITKEAKTQKEE